MSGFVTVGHFLVSTFFSLVIFVLWARLFVRYFTISPFLPVTQSIYQLTNPLVSPLQRYIIRGVGARGAYDWACFLLLLVCELLKFFVLNALFFQNALSVTHVVLYTVVELLLQPCNLMFYAIVLRIIISWLMPTQSPAFNVLYAVTEPLLRRFRRWLPPIGVIDFSAMAALIVLKVIELYVLQLLPFGQL